MVLEMDGGGRQDQAIDCPVLITERLVMRLPHEDDIPYIAKLADSRRIAEMLARMPSPYGTDDAREFVAMCAQRRTGGCTYALTLADNGAFVGCAGLDAGRSGTLDAGTGALELGYWIGEPYWGRGFASEAANALVDLAFRATATDRLTVSCRTVNPASRRVIRKCGFRYAGRGMMDSLAAGRVPVERYRLDRDAWADLRTWAGR